MVWLCGNFDKVCDVNNFRPKLSKYTSLQNIQFSSVQLLSHVWHFATPWTEAQQASLSITNSWSLLKLMSIESVMPTNHLVLCRPFISCLQFFPASGSFLMSQLFASGGQSVGASGSASVPLMNIQCWFPLGLLVWSPCSPRDSQESSPTLHLKSINSSALSFLYSLTLTSTHDHWKNHSFDYVSFHCPTILAVLFWFLFLSLRISVWGSPSILFFPLNSLRPNSSSVLVLPSSLDSEFP